MIEITPGYNNLDIDDKGTYTLKVERDGLGYDGGVIVTLSGSDLKKLVALLNLSIGNVPQPQDPRELLRAMDDILGLRENQDSDTDENNTNS